MQRRKTLALHSTFSRATGHAMNAALAKGRATKQLELLALRSFDFADRVDAGEIKFLDAVDVLYHGAVASGLVDAVGDDIVQATLAAAFASVVRRYA